MYSISIYTGAGDVLAQDAHTIMGQTVTVHLYIKGLGNVKLPSPVSVTDVPRLTERKVTHVLSQRALDIDTQWITGSTFLKSGELVLCDAHHDKLLLFSPDLTLKDDLNLSGK